VVVVQVIGEVQQPPVLVALEERLNSREMRDPHLQPDITEEEGKR
jgi:hypothetical protein